MSLDMQCSTLSSLSSNGQPAGIKLLIPHWDLTKLPYRCKRAWPGTERVTSHYLNHYWPSAMIPSGFIEIKPERFSICIIKISICSLHQHQVTCCSGGLARDVKPLHSRHNDHDGVSNHQPHGCLLNRLFSRRSKKTSKLRVTGLCVGNSPGPVNSPHKGPVTRKMFPFDDVIMRCHETKG